jgi:hypothetical protein
MESIMKKLVALLSTVLLGISLSACGKIEDKKDDAAAATTDTTQAATPADTAPKAEEPKQQ